MRYFGYNSVLIHIAVLMALALPYCMNLGESSIWDANEAFYAETPREMLASGDYLAPQFNFEPRAQKPPLTYWVVLISYRLFGVNEFAVRLPSALAAIGTLLFSYGIARLLFSLRAALFAAVITATTARVFILARRLPIDILLLFFLTGTLFFMVHAIRKNHRLGWALAYGFAGLGFLTKGPVAVVLPAGALVLWALWSRRFRLSDARPLMGAAIFGCLVLPWYLLIYRAHGWTYISPFFLRDNLGRFAGESLGPSRSIFYYFSVYATDFFPWSIAVLFALYFLWIRRNNEQPLKNLSFGLPVIWCALTFILFSLSRNKQEYYIAPIYTAAAVILSGVLERMSAGGTDQDSPRRGAWIWMYGFLATSLLCLAALVPYVLKSFIPGISPMLHYGPSLVLIGGFLLLAWNLIRGGHVLCFSSLAIPLWTIYMLCALLYLPAIEAFRPIKDFCRIIQSQSEGDDEAGFFGTAVPSMVFYLRRPIFQENSHERMVRRLRSGKQVFCILAQRDYEYFADQKDLNLFILDRRPRFAVRFGTLFNTANYPGEELLLISNKVHPENQSGGSGPAL